MSEAKGLEDLAKKLDTLIALYRLVNRLALESYMNEVVKDKTASKILDITNESISYSDLARVAAQDLGVAEITVKKKTAELVRMGLLLKTRKGKEVYYENSGLLT